MVPRNSTFFPPASCGVEGRSQKGQDCCLSKYQKRLLKKAGGGSAKELGGGLENKKWAVRAG